MQNPEPATVEVICSIKVHREVDVACLTHAGYRATGVQKFNDSEDPKDFPDIFVINLIPSEGDGFMLAERIRSLSQKAGILLVISQALRSDRTRALMSGADIFIAKPYTEQELIATVACLSRRLRA